MFFWDVYLFRFIILSEFEENDEYISLDFKEFNEWGGIEMFCKLVG